MNHHLLDHNWAHQPLFLSQNSFGRVDFSFLLFAFSLLLLHHLQLVPICHGFWSFPNRDRHLWSLILKHKDIKCPPVCWHRDDPGWESKEGRCHKCSPLAASPPPDASVSWSGSSCLLNQVTVKGPFASLSSKTILEWMSYVFPSEGNGRSSDIGSYIGSLLKRGRFLIYFHLVWDQTSVSLYFRPNVQP